MIVVHVMIVDFEMNVFLVKIGDHGKTEIVT